MCSIDQMYNMTGADRAVQLVRQCWSSAPFSDAEKSALGNVMAVCRGKYPCVMLLCVGLLRSSEQVHFLHADVRREEFVPATFDDVVDYDESIAYRCKKLSQHQSQRRQLTSSEQIQILGEYSHQKEPLEQTETADVEGAPITLEKVDELERTCYENVAERLADDCGNTFPLLRPESCTAIENSIYVELESSWNAHTEISSKQFFLKSWCRERLLVVKRDVAHARIELEDYLKRSIHGRTDQHHFGSLMVAFCRLADLLPRVSNADLTRALYEPEWISGFNPLLSGSSKKSVYGSMILWHRLCVLEDKLLRLTNPGDVLGETEMLRELKSNRIWDCEQFPAWLAFEVENRIQIRPEQYVVAHHLITNPGDVCQLNMGLGKTRVILPMLVLHWSFHIVNKEQRLTRLNILPSLFSEAYEFYSHELCGSIANLKIFLLPFSRDVRLDDRRVGAINRLLDRCRQDRGMFLAAPEHRLSLELKQIELVRLKELDLYGKLETVCKSSNWRDILDESDEILHHRFRLVYACGSVEELPAGMHRYRAPQLLLRYLKESALVKKWAGKNTGFVNLGEAEHSEVWPNVNINMEVATENLVTEFNAVLADALLDEPPYELDWLCNHPARDEIKKVISELASTIGNLMALNLSANHLDDILSLRGLLAGGILIYCLQKRHRVEYGIARPGRKRLAVPFRGADTPAMRSEFAQADCAIALTLLSYYSDGLNEDQIREAFRTLLRLGKEARRKLYNSWFEIGKPHMLQTSSEQANKLDCIEKIDLSNTNQFANLKRYFSRNVRTIDFWLNYCVFPTEMQHYPHRLTATAWNLAESDNGIVGFSGTNDNHRLLPLQVKQHFVTSYGQFESSEVSLVWKELTATNGAMLSCILDHTEDCLELALENGSAFIIDTVANADKRIDAVVDSGAVFAGHANIEIARKLLKALPSTDGEYRYPGVAFYDNSESPGQWKILERAGRVLPKHQSPITEKEAFAFFDEPRCRGTDLKLRTSAVALLTLGKKMCKDKLMQAAGRMRKLGKGQKLLIAATKDVMDQVRELTKASTVTAKHILEWTLHNTCTSNAEGLPAWASQGLFHGTSHGNPALIVEDEKKTLKEIFGGSFEAIEVREAVQFAMKHYRDRAAKAGATLTEEQEQLIGTIMESARLYGEHRVKTIEGGDQECERELELEQELEEEEEVEVPRLVAREENNWEVSQVFRIKTASELPEDAHVSLVAKFVKKHLTPPSLDHIGWSRKVYGTKNFFTAVIEDLDDFPECLNHYLRLVDVGILFPSGEVLLVSEREADLLMEEYWRSQDQNSLSKEHRSILFHLTFARSAANGTIPGLTMDMATLAPKGSNHLHLSDEILVALQLFAGETVFPTRSRKNELKRILKGNNKASSEPEHIVNMRGHSHTLPYSDLEEVCKEVARLQEVDEFQHHRTL